MVAIVIAIVGAFGGVCASIFTYLDRRATVRKESSSEASKADNDKTTISFNMMQVTMEETRAELKETKLELAATRAANDQLQTAIVDLRIELADTRRELKVTQAELAELQRGS